MVLFGVTVPKHYLTNYRDSKSSCPPPSLTSYDADANQILEELAWDDLETCCQKLQAEMVYKSVNGLTPNYLSSKFIQRSDVITSYNLRDSDGKLALPLPRTNYLTIIPRARMGYESIAHEAEGRMGY